MTAVLYVNIYFVISLIVLPGPSSGGTLTEYNNLYNTTLKGYNKDCRPQRNTMIATLYFYLRTSFEQDDHCWTFSD